MADERGDASARRRGRARARRRAPHAPGDGGRGEPRTGDERTGSGPRRAPRPRRGLRRQGGAPSGRQPVLARHAVAGPALRRPRPAPVAAVHHRGGPRPGPRRRHDDDGVRHRRQPAAERRALRRAASAGRAAPVGTVRRRSRAAGRDGRELAQRDDAVRTCRDVRPHRGRLHRRRRAGDPAGCASIAGHVPASRRRTRAREVLRAGRGGARRRHHQPHGLADPFRPGRGHRGPRATPRRPRAHHRGGDAGVVPVSRCGHHVLGTLRGGPRRTRPRPPTLRVRPGAPRAGRFVRAGRRPRGRPGAPVGRRVGVFGRHDPAQVAEPARGARHRRPLQLGAATAGSAVPAVRRRRLRAADRVRQRREPVPVAGVGARARVRDSRRGRGQPAAAVPPAPDRIGGHLGPCGAVGAGPRGLADRRRRRRRASGPRPPAAEPDRSGRAGGVLGGVGRPARGRRGDAAAGPAHDRPRPHAADPGAGGGRRRRPRPAAGRTGGRPERPRGGPADRRSADGTLALDAARRRDRLEPRRTPSPWSPDCPARVIRGRRRAPASSRNSPT